ncbi:hypothetical protein BgAZ_203760 [Babesia gibsoni]|uniref:Uncharacterized protein n=1 Tax=Babesia gibsoni TaxID=33632 RepID=A0AAD8LSZ3_BABGI|nr:hypothetical protein BgAZ_203760 [Babesia gibsoni]
MFALPYIILGGIKCNMFESKSAAAASSITQTSGVLRGVRGSTLSVKEAYITIKLCLRTGIVDEELFRHCLSIVEAGYFSPVLSNGWGIDTLSSDKDHEGLPRSCFDAINGLHICDKASLWQEKFSSNLGKQTPKVDPTKSHKTQDIDPEGRERYTTKKLGKVLDPKPLRVRIRKMAAGKKLANTVALQLRESVREASLSELADICTIFACRLPLSGQLNDDTILMLASRLSEFSPKELSSVLHHIAIMCSAASMRSYETWSFTTTPRGVRSSQTHRLCRIGRKELPKHFLEKVASAAELYSRDGVIAAPLGSRLGYPLEPLDEHIQTVRLLAHSDMPLSITLWDDLLSKKIPDGSQVKLSTVLSFFEAVDYAKYYTPGTIDKAKWLLSCKRDEGSDGAYHGDMQRAIDQLLYFSSVYSQERQSKDIIDTLDGIRA